jgi:predicted secreted protein
MQRGKKVAVVAHCLLDVNTKVKGLATYAGVHPIVRELISEDVGIIQLPCPEVVHLGMRRWGMTKEQYDVPSYRRLCERLVEPVLDTLRALADDGCEIVGIWGVDGSPSCGVTVTCAGFSGGELESLDALPASTHVPGEGVFLSILREACFEAGLDVPFRTIAEKG